MRDESALRFRRTGSGVVLEANGCRTSGASGAVEWDLYLSAIGSQRLRALSQTIWNSNRRLLSGECRAGRENTREPDQQRTGCGKSDGSRLPHTENVRPERTQCRGSEKLLNDRSGGALAFCLLEGDVAVAAAEGGGGHDGSRDG